MGNHKNIKIVKMQKLISRSRYLDILVNIHCVGLKTNFKIPRYFIVKRKNILSTTDVHGSLSDKNSDDLTQHFTVTPCFCFDNIM